MATESACKLRVGRDQYEGVARLDVDHIDFAGATKYRFRLAEIANPRRKGDTIQFSFHGNPVSLTISSVRVAEEWIAYVQNPQTLADKLGVCEGSTVQVLNIDDSELMSSLESKKTKVLSGSNGRCDMVMLGVERAAELRQIGDLSRRLRPEGVIWVVLPKSVRTVTKANVFAAAREAGMKQVEVLDFSDNRAAYKMVHPATVAKK
jgi:hypothetical protein